MKGNKTKHISDNERFTIEKMLNAKKKQKEIARVLERGQSTISEEIKRGSNGGIYTAQYAKHRAYVKQYYKKKDCLAVSMNKDIYKEVVLRIKQGQSPEMISSRLKNKEVGKYVSSKAIRKFVSKRRPDLERYLFWNRVKLKSGRKRDKGIYLKDSRPFIEQRLLDYPLFDLEYGHWEGDFIVSKHNKFVLLVLTERLSKYTEIRLLPNRKNHLVNKVISSVLSKYQIKSLTLDNDIAFTKWKDLAKQLNVNIYFTHPFHSWEKGLVENINRWIRVFAPKRSDLSKIKNTAVIADWLNSIPRIVLDGSSSYEVMFERENGVRISSLVVDYPVRIWG